MGDKTPHISFLGLLVERKTDFLALAAFLISVMTATYQLMGMLAGPKLNIHAPSSVMVLRPSCDPRDIVSFVVHNNFSNSGAEGQESVVTEIYLAFEREDFWQVLINTNKAEMVRNLVSEQQANDLCKQPELGVYSIHQFYAVETIGRATPLVVQAGSVASPIHLFGSLSRICKSDPSTCGGALSAITVDDLLTMAAQKAEIELLMAYVFDNEIRIRRCTFAMKEAPAAASDSTKLNYEVNFFREYGFVMSKCDKFEPAQGDVALRFTKFIKDRAS